MYKKDLALNNLQWLMYIPNIYLIYMYKKDYPLINIQGLISIKHNQSTNLHLYTYKISYEEYMNINNFDK